jgi:hypothetical protein
VGGEGVLDGGGAEPVKEVVGVGLVLGLEHDDGALADFGIGLLGDTDKRSGLLHLRRGGRGEGDEAELRVAGLDELRGLRDVFRLDDARLELVVELHPGEGGDGGAAVGCVIGVGDGEGHEARIAESVLRERLERRVLARPEDEDAASIGNGLSGVGEVSGDDLLGEAEVGGEEEVGGGAVEDLRGERGGGGVAGDDLDTGFVLEPVGERGEDGLEVRGGEDADFAGGGGLGGGWEGERRRKEGGEEDFEAVERPEAKASCYWCGVYRGLKPAATPTAHAPGARVSGERDGTCGENGSMGGGDAGGIGVLRLRIARLRDAALRMTGSIGLRLMLGRNGSKPARCHHFPFDVTA